MTITSPKAWAVGPGLMLTPISDDDMYGALPKPDSKQEIYEMELKQLEDKGGPELIEALCGHGCMGESVDEEDIPATFRVTIFQQDNAEHMCFTTVDGERLPLTQMDTYENEYYWMRTVFRLLGQRIS
jgi:hypothetical protein